LKAVEAEVCDAPPNLALAMHECNLNIYELIARKSGNQSLLQDVRDLMPQVETETR
jgi:hypothetical protein